jgi:hypothetical protein
LDGAVCFGCVVCGAGDKVCASRKIITGSTGAAGESTILAGAFWLATAPSVSMRQRTQMLHRMRICIGVSPMVAARLSDIFGRIASARFPAMKCDRASVMARSG